MVMGGFVVTGLGLTTASVAIANSSLVFPANTSDFSFFTAATGASPIIVAAASLVNDDRNYIELGLTTESGTPLSKTFWDASANAGSGSEFVQTVDTVDSLAIKVTVLQGGFSGSADATPLAILDVNSSGVITSIFDRRELLGRLAAPGNPSAEFTWASKIEPIYNLTLTDATGTFVDDEVLTLGHREMVLTTASAGFTVGETIQDDSDATIQGVVISSSGTVPNITVQYYLIGAPLTDFSASTGAFTGQTSSSTATAVAPTDIADTAKVITGGTPSGGNVTITFNQPTGSAFFPVKSNVRGGTSAANGIIGTILEAFTGADKDIQTIEDNLKAIMTEIKKIKGTNFWYEDALKNLGNVDGSIVVGVGGGTANVQTITATPAFIILNNGLRVTYKPTVTNTGATTITLDSFVAKSVLKIAQGVLVPLVAGDLVVNIQTDLIFVTENDAYILLHPAQLLFADGSAAAPSITFSNQTNTGLSLTSSSLLMSVAGFAAFNVASIADGIRIANTYSLGWTPAAANTNAPDLRLWRDAANTLAQRNGTNAQEFRLYKTFTDSNNYERLNINTERNTGTYEILVTHAGTGNSGKNLLVGTAGTGVFVIATGNNDRWYVNSSGHFIGATDNIYDIGASGANRPRDLFLGGNATIDGIVGIAITTPTEALDVRGNINITPLSTPAAPTVTPQGTTEITLYSYRISAISGTGETIASTAGTTVTGNATLTVSNFNRVTWTAVAGARQYKIYGRTSESELLMSTQTALTFDDDGSVTPSGALPTSNSTGILTGGTVPLARMMRIEAQNTTSTNITGSQAILVSLNLGVVNTGDRILVSGTVTATKGGTVGDVSITLFSITGSSIAVFPSGSISAIVTQIDIPASEDVDFVIFALCSVTTGGTLTIDMRGFSEGSNTTATTNALHCIVLNGG